MDKKVDINELSDIIKKLDSFMPLDVLIRSKLSGGWVTIQGKASIIENNNIKNSIDLKVISKESQDGSIIRIIGEKTKKFNLCLSPSHYKEIKRQGINIDMVKTDNNSCKLKIDDNIIFSIDKNEQIVNELIFK